MQNDNFMESLSNLNQPNINLGTDDDSDKRYFTIGEVSTKCGIKPHVLRYWEQEFSKLRPTKRRKRRYYQQKDIEMVNLIKDLLYRQGFTIEGARQQLKLIVKGEPTAEEVIAEQVAEQNPQPEPAQPSPVVRDLIGGLEGILSVLREDKVREEAK